MNQDLFEHRLPALGATATGRYGKASDNGPTAPVDPDRHLDDFLSLMHAQHDSAKALHEVHKQALNAPDPRTAEAVYHQAHAAIADHFDDIHADKPDWSQSLRRDLDADRKGHTAQLQAAAGPAKQEAAKQQVGAVVTNYARMAAEGDADRFGDRARRTVFAGAAAGLYPPEEAKTRFDDFAGKVERFKREQARNAGATEPKSSASKPSVPVAEAVPETTKSLEAWAGQLAERERKRMLGDPDVDGGDLSAEIERYTDALVHASPESKPVLQHLTMLLFSKYHDNAATGQLSDLIDDFTDSPLTAAQRRESLAQSRFLDLYLNEAQLNQTLNTKNAFANLALALGTGRMLGGKGGLAEPAVVKPTSPAARPASKPPAASAEVAPSPKASEPAVALDRPIELAPPTAKPQATTPAPNKGAFNEGDPAAVKAYLNRPIRGNEGPDGHVLDLHVGKPELELRERLKSDPGIKASSSFPDERATDRLIQQTLSGQQEKVLKWLKNPKSGNRLTLVYEGKEPIGISVRRNGSLEICTTATIVLKKDNQGGFYYFTAYPCK